MDSTDLEREKGITILAKNTAIQHGDVKINIVDTPGHADFGGEVERGLTMVDGILLLVDASEGPLPQTRFVLRKALEQRLPVVLVVNKVDRPDARSRGGRRRGLRALPRPRRRRVPDRVPDRLRQRARGQGRARARRAAPTTSGRSSTRSSRRSPPRPTTRIIRSRRSSRTSTRARTSAGSRCCGSATACSGRARRSPGAARTGRSRRARVTELYVTEALDRVPTDEAGPGEIVALAGLPEVTIGETIADLDDPRPLPVTSVDEPSPLGHDRDQHEPTRRQRGRPADREPGEGAARRRARRQRLAAHPPHVAAGCVGGAGAGRAPAGRPGRADAPGGLRADRRKAGGADEGARRQAARAGRARRDRHPGRVHRRRDAAARAAQGPAAGHGQPRHRVGAARVPRPCPRA